MIIDCISDLHGHYPKLEGGDLLIVAGDLTATDTIYEHADFLGWLNVQNYKKKVFIYGNHDNKIDKQFSWDDSIEYLCDSGTEFEYQEQIDHPASTEHVSIDVLMYQTKKLKIWGSPWTKTFPGMNPHCMAFTCDTEEELAEKWDKIPEDIDILITHSPPFGILDQAKRLNYPDRKTRIDNLRVGNIMNGEFEHVGSKSLDKKMGKMKNTKLFVWGHIHEAYGEEEINYSGKSCKMINASHVNERYEPVNKPVRVIL